MAQKFKIGDVVGLKSGGPPMTVANYHSTENEIVFCKWFAGKNLEEEYFHQDALKPEKQQAKK